jgi:hypothetical protein
MLLLGCTPGPTVHPPTVADVADLLFWADPTYGQYQERASQTTPVAADGDPIGSWVLRVGGTLTAPADDRRPARFTQSGKTMVRWNNPTVAGEPDHFLLPAPIALTGPFTLYYVLYRAASTDPVQVFGSAAGGPAMLGVNPTNGRVMDVYDDGVGYSTAAGLTVVGFMLPSIMRRDAGGTFAWNRFRGPNMGALFTGGGLGHATGTITLGVYGARTTVTTRETTANASTGDVILVGRDIIGTADDTLIRAYLAAKYGLTVGVDL